MKRTSKRGRERVIYYGVKKNSEEEGSAVVFGWEGEWKIIKKDG